MLQAKAYVYFIDGQRPADSEEQYNSGADQDWLTREHTRHDNLAKDNLDRIIKDRHGTFPKGKQTSCESRQRLSGYDVNLSVIAPK